MQNICHNKRVTREENSSETKSTLITLPNVVSEEIRFGLIKVLHSAPPFRYHICKFDKLARRCLLLSNAFLRNHHFQNTMSNSQAIFCYFLMCKIIVG